MIKQIKIAVLGTLLAVSHLTLANPYPNKAVKAIVPFPAGGPTDIVARPFAEALSDALKQPVVIENRGGAGGSVGAAATAKAAKDGYTLLVGTVGTSSINPALYKTLSYNPDTELEPIAILAAAPVALVVHPSLNVKTVADLRALSEKKILRYGSAGSGTPGHLTGELFKANSGIALEHVPYRGSAPALQDLLGGHIDVMFDPLQSVLPHIQGQKVVAVALSSDKRSALLPAIPTFQEAKVETKVTAWWGLFAPKDIAEDVKATLVNAAQAAYSSSKVKHLESIGIALVAPQSAEEIASFLNKEKAIWAGAVQLSGATVD